MKGWIYVNKVSDNSETLFLVNIRNITHIQDIQKLGYKNISRIYFSVEAKEAQSNIAVKETIADLADKIAKAS